MTDDIIERVRQSITEEGAALGLPIEIGQCWFFFCGKCDLQETFDTEREASESAAYHAEWRHGHRAGGEQ